MSEHTISMSTTDPVNPDPINPDHFNPDPGSPVRVKVGHLVAGLIFLGLAGSWALRASGVIDDVTVGWLLPAILVAAGVIGLLAMLAGGVRRNRPQQPVIEQEVDRPTNEFDDQTHTTTEEYHR